jgi:hypothetical protein
MPARWHSIVLRRVVLAAVSVCVAIWLGILLYNWPFSHKAVTAALEEESGKAVRIGTFRSTLSPLGYVAENVSFFPDGAAKDTAELTIRKLVVIARPLDLLLMRKRMEQVLVTGLRADIRPQKEGGRKPAPPRFSEIGKVQFDDAVVKFPTVESDADPLTLTIKTITFIDMSKVRSGAFSAEFSVNEPGGVVRLSGHTGPWDWKHMGRTPISGSFALTRADLASLRGVEGVLNAAGRFTGPLSHIVCSGTADVPDFRVSKSSHSVNLSSTFRTSLNGLTGDTTLDTAESHFNRTVIESQGQVRKDPQRPGKAAFVRLSVQEGQVEDILLLFTRAPQPSMAGTVDLRMNVEIPPGPPGFLKKLALTGDFGIDRGRFTKAKTQTPINHLSESAVGMGKEARKESRQTVLSDVAGHISAQHGLATLSHISFAMPGAHGVISGTYDLLSQAVNLEGRLVTTGELSSTTSGFKAVMLKILTPFLTRHSVTVLPFTITGTAQHPVFSLNLLNKHHHP